ncbi:DUF190 domain-containing protein [Mycobacterium uberis]|uniref:DUF190 domain-containing protein n=1 Tax=Mycobacterium uberis TaxID=2162698 RepID=UPI000E2FF5E2|nr:DUF190 domain-containing protein [Mycobacterium uberis]
MSGNGSASSRLLADSILDLFDARDVATSVMLRGIASFEPNHELCSDASLSLSEDPAVAIAAVGVKPKIHSLVHDVTAMTSHGLLTLERAVPAAESSRYQYTR